eukprot:scaffold153720_cov31-Tisochrysis_lutea.AAC.5
MALNNSRRAGAPIALFSSVRLRNVMRRGARRAVSPLAHARRRSHRRRSLRARACLWICIEALSLRARSSLRRLLCRSSRAARARAQHAITVTAAKCRRIPLTWSALSAARAQPITRRQAVSKRNAASLCRQYWAAHERARASALSRVTAARAEPKYERARSRRAWRCNTLAREKLRMRRARMIQLRPTSNSTRAARRHPCHLRTLRTAASTARAQAKKNPVDCHR